jgi:signal transduction histidine kinase
MLDEFSEKAPFAAALLDSDGRIVSANLCLAQLLEIESEQLKTRLFSDFWKPSALDVAGAVSAGGYCLSRTGKKVPRRLERWSTANTSDQATYAVALIDCNEELDAALLDQLRRFSSAFGHQVRNPIAGVTGALTILRSRLALTGENAAIIEEILERLHQLSDGVGTLVDFGRPIAPLLTSISALHVLQESVESLPPETTLNVKFLLPLDDAQIRGDAKLLGRCLVHVLENAAEALNGRGNVVVRISQQDSMAVLEIEDNGPGCKDKVLDQLFVPFFTTKPQNMGLGLALVRRIMNAHGGDIDVRKNQGRGLTLALRIPMA